MNLIIAILFILFNILFAFLFDIIPFFPIPNILEEQKYIKTMLCNCKYNGPYEGEVLNAETGMPINNAFVIFWWIEKKKAKNIGRFYEIKHIYKTFTAPDGSFFVPKYPKKRNPFLCSPSFIIYKEGYLNLNLKNYIKNKEIKCFRNKEKCKFYLLKSDCKNKEDCIKPYIESLPIEIVKELKNLEIN